MPVSVLCTSRVAIVSAWVPPSLQPPLRAPMIHYGGESTGSTGAAEGWSMLHSSEADVWVVGHPRSRRFETV